MIRAEQQKAEQQGVEAAGSDGAKEPEAITNTEEATEPAPDAAMELDANVPETPDAELPWSKPAERGWVQFVTPAEVSALLVTLDEKVVPAAPA